MAQIVSTFDVADCNKALADAGFAYRIHLHDACGGQSLSYECTRTACDQPFMLRTWLRDFFAKRGYTLLFHESEPLFWIA